MKDAWEIIRIDYPRSKAVFVYSSNGVDFCLFDLNKENKFVLFCSPSFPQIVKFSLDNVQKPEAIQKCFMKLPDDEAHNSDGLKFFGGIFELEEGKECELQIGMDICSGKFLATVRRKIDIERKKIMPEAANVWTWWEGNIVITPETTPKQ